MINLDRSFVGQTLEWSIRSFPNCFNDTKPAKLVKVDEKQIQNLELSYQAPIKHSVAMRPFLFVAQVIYIIAISVFIAPLGTIFHLVNTFVLAGKYCFSKCKSDVANKISTNVKSFFKDAVLVLIPAMFFMPVMLQVIIIGEMLTPCFLMMLMSPDWLYDGYYKNLSGIEKENFLRSGYLYRNFGIATKNGKMLPWDSTVVREVFDVEKGRVEGVLGTALIKKASALVALRDELQNMLLMSREDTDELFSKTLDQFNSYMARHHSDCQEWCNRFKLVVKDIDGLADNFFRVVCGKEAFRNYAIRRGVISCLAQQYIYVVIKDPLFDITLHPQINFNCDYFFKYFFGDFYFRASSNTFESQEALWKKELEKKLHFLRPVGSSVPSAEYGAFRQRVRQLQLPEQLLGFTNKPNTPTEVEACYRKCMRYLHPDNVSRFVLHNENRELQEDEKNEANFLCTCAALAKDNLLKKLEDSSTEGMS